jgi:hypothetical protein
LVCILQLPVVDVDMQQPAYYTPPDPDGQKSELETQDEEKFVKRYARKQGRLLSITEKKHVTMMDSLKSSYKNWIYPPRSLDQCFYEWLEEEENYRNGDQVLSRYIARHWFKTGNKPSEVPQSTSEATLVNPETMAAGIDMTPRQLESQDTLPMSRRNENPTLAIPTSEAPQQIFWKQSFLGLNLPEELKLIRGWNKEYRKTELLAELSENAPAPPPRTARQQILVVPEFWIWRVGSTY